MAMNVNPQTDVTTLTRSVRKDPSLWVLCASNIFAIILAVIQNWDMGEVLILYWIQSVIIGVSNYTRIMNLKGFSVDGLTMNGKTVEETPETKRKIANFFAIHYGMFHVVYFIFLVSGQGILGVAVKITPAFVLAILGFIGSHAFSVSHNKKRDFKNKKPNIGTLLFYPYLRIIPMHIIIITTGAFITNGSISIVLLIAFLGMKTLADMGMHIVEHRMFQKHSTKHTT